MLCECATPVPKDVGLIVFAVLLVGDLFHQLGVLCTTCNQAMGDMLRHFDSLQQLPPTQLTNLRSGSALTSTYRFSRLCVCVTPVPKDVGLTISAVMSAGGQWTLWKALPNEDLSSLS